jgi:outer membrane protein, multidrug efflux system
MKRVILLVAALISPSCAVGPNFLRPSVGVPSKFRGSSSESAESIADLGWWQAYRDAELQSLIREALRNNKDLHIAATRVEQARQAAAQARSGFWPWVTYDMEGGTSRGSTSAGPGGRTQFSGGGVGQSGSGGFSVSDEMSDYASIVAGAVWEIDLWGRIRRMNEAARARFFASEEGRRGVIVSLVAQVAQAYFELIELDLELEIARRTQKSFDQSLNLFQQRLEGGVASRLETSRAEAAQAQAGATIPEVERQIAIKENQLCLLLGRVPGPIRPRAALSEKGLPARVPAGIPAALVERRPDIIATEHDLRAANADIGAAIAEFFPKIGLTSSYGRVSHDLSAITLSQGKAWSVAATAAGPIFQGGLLRANVRAARARWDEARIAHERAVLTALGEVSNALISRQKLAQARVSQERAVASLTEAVSVSTERYTAGKSSYYEILEAQQQLFPTEINLARTRLNQYVALIQLYRALGGGWNVAPSKKSTDAIEQKETERTKARPVTSAAKD